jgi:hypothetical protein
MRTFILFVALLLCSACYGQKSYNQKRKHSPVRSKSFQERPHNYNNEGEVVNLGLGAGIDYGGFGVRCTYLPDPHLGIFAAGGNAIAGFGYNIGAMFRLQPEKRLVPTISGMYGYNATLLVKNASNLNQVFYGPSGGLGVIYKSANDIGYWHFELLLPFRSTDFDKTLNSSRLSFYTKPLPVLFSLGYHLRL